MALVDDFIDAGFDILNPVQCSAVGMDPQTLKDRFGERITFWGGGVDTQKTLQENCKVLITKGSGPCFRAKR